MFFQPRYVKQAREMAHGAEKLLRYRRDVLDAADIARVRELVDGLRRAASGRDRALVTKTASELDALCGGLAPPRPHAGWRENIEVLVVAIVIAAGIKAYILQPFKIPTGSMQPTLNGIIGFPQEEKAPNFLVQAWQYVWNGRNYIHVVSKTDGNQVLEMHKLQRLHFFTFTRMTLKDGSLTVYAPPETLVRDFGVRPGKTYNRGDVIARGFIDTGDQVFVDKVTYNFRAPKRGDVFVFKTTGIRKIEAGIPAGLGSQFYIKRLTGLPGDTLRIDPPQLLINGKPPAEPGIARVARSEAGYRGYSNGSAVGGHFEFLGSPNATFTVPSHSFFALGDNSFNSSDSRHWGIVPERNVVGRGFVVYWPFGQNFGPIR